MTDNTTTLIVTIDTEEEGLWGSKYRSSGNTVENLKGIPQFQALCEEYGVRPTYLVDTPVVEDDYAASLLKDYQKSSVAEVGAHLHPWCTKPFEESLNSRNSFMLNLSEDLQRKKLINLTDAIERRMDQRPTSFRAGRYGLDEVGLRILSDLGYIVDSSVIPFSDFSNEGGPDFDRAPYHPYFPAMNDLLACGDQTVLLEVPVSTGFNRLNFERAASVRRFVLRTFLRKLRVVGILDRLGLVSRIKLSPEQADAKAMNRLIKNYQRQQAPCVVMMMHSSSFVAGHSPYCPNDEKLELFYENLAGVFSECRSRNMPSATLTEYALSHQSAESTSELVAANT